MTPDNHQPKLSVAAQILARIESDHIKPTPRYSFIARESFFMSLIGVIIIMGTLAVAVIIFISQSVNYALYEATHNNFTTFLFDVVPLLWGLSFIALICLLYTQLSTVKHGYRYTALQIIGGSVALSVIGGIILHGMGFGYALDQFLGKQVAMYKSMEKMELQMWQMPNSGRLVGTIIPEVIADNDNVLETYLTTFSDVSGVVWSVNTSELNEREHELLEAEHLVRLLGTSTAPGVFHACGAFAWMFENDWGKGRQEMNAQRIEFESKMQFYQDRRHQSDGMMVPPPDNTMICAHFDMIRGKKGS